MFPLELPPSLVITPSSAAYYAESFAAIVPLKCSLDGRMVWLVNRTQLGAIALISAGHRVAAGHCEMFIGYKPGPLNIPTFTDRTV